MSDDQKYTLNEQLEAEADDLRDLGYKVVPSLLDESRRTLNAQATEIARLQGVLDEMSEAWPEHRVDCVEPRDEGERILQHFARKARTALKGGSHD
jgi:hypothetical protein